MPLSCPRHPEHCGCAGIPPSWKLPIPLGAAVDINLAGLEGLVPELCPSAVPGLPQDLLQGVEGRGVWPSAGPISIGSYGASATSRTWASLLLQQTLLEAGAGVGTDGKEGSKSKGKTSWEERQVRERRGHGSPSGQPAAALQPRGPGSSSSFTLSAPPAQPLGPNFPITWQHSTWDGREGTEQGMREHFGAMKGWGQRSPVSGQPWAGSTQGHGGDIQHGLSSPSPALHSE